MNLYLTRQQNGLYMLTKYKPVFAKVEGKDFEDAYVMPGEPVGIRNFCNFILSVVGLKEPLKRGESILVTISGKIVEQ